jgi:alpha-ketoglutarate-dependent taurine dioxygenase
MTTMAIRVTPLQPFGARVEGTDAAFLSSDAVDPREILDLLERHGVLIFPEVGLDDAAQVAFGRRLGEIVTKTSSSPGRGGEFPEIFKVSLDRSVNDAPYMKATIYWHLDGSTEEIPSKASLLTARALPSHGTGGNTEFVSTYMAYDDLTAEEQQRFEGLHVVHTPEASYRCFDPNPTDEILARLRTVPPKTQPLVWHHRDGRKSLVLGSTAWYVEGMDRDEGAALLAQLLERAAAPDRVLAHEWKVGDLVIWDNRGTLHRATPYEHDSGREMHRVTLVGDEAIVGAAS